MTSIASSTIRAIGYRELTQELWVDFLSGGTRVYQGVGPTELRRLMSAATASKGQYLTELIRERSTWPGDIARVACA